jgi:hypothetical protein
MASDRQIAANRLNAQQSTGPHSPAGKAKVSRNALKHGLTARDVVLPHEDPADFESFRGCLLASLDPRGALEDFFAQKIVTDAWRLQRVSILEATLYRYGCKVSLLRQAEEAVSKSQRLADVCLGGDQGAYEEAKRRLADVQHQLEDPSFNVALVLKTSPEPFLNLGRHEAALLRSLQRMMHELERLQARRGGEHVPAPEVVDVDVSVPESSETNGNLR